MEKLKPTLILILGLPGAGKSTFVKKQVTTEYTRLVINMDDLRLAYGHRYEESLEPAVTQLTYHMVVTALSQGHNVVIDESITDFDLAAALVAVGHGNDAEVVMVELDTPTDVCWSRREKTGFLRDEFVKKQQEWAENREAIIELGDVHIRLVQYTKTEDHAAEEK